jgi:hypothetical protein
VCALIRYGQKLGDEDALVIAQNLNLFKRLHGLNLVIRGCAVA